MNKTAIISSVALAGALAAALAASLPRQHAAETRRRKGEVLRHFARRQERLRRRPRHDLRRHQQGRLQRQVAWKLVPEGHLRHHDRRRSDPARSSRSSARA